MVGAGLVYMRISHKPLSSTCQNLISHPYTPHTTHHQWYSSKILYTYDRAATDRVRHLHTTHNLQFLGLADSFGLWPNSDYADDVIVGVLNTGIWPERPSFFDDGLSPVPSGWKGICETAPDFPSSTCNKKIIGVRAYYSGYTAKLGSKIDETIESLSPRDTEGHGTHTASTAAGSVVANASFFQYAKGEARGMTIKARIAVYKICWTLGCYDSDILAAMDQAVADGVHVISLSVGASGYASQYDHDSIAIGAFGAAQHGVVVSCSTENGGSKYPLVYADDCGSRYCYTQKLDPSKVTVKIVIWDRGGNGGERKCR